MTGRFAPVPLLLGRRETAEDESEKDAMFSIVRSRSGPRFGDQDRRQDRIVAFDMASALVAAPGKRGVASGQSSALLMHCCKVCRCRWSDVISERQAMASACRL